GQELPRETSELLCERAVGFHEEWFGEDSPLLAEVLGLVLDLDPLENVWAFQRLTVVHTIAERWNELLALYDRTIASAKDDLRKESLLEEAAQTAKDFAGQPDRAIDYLRELVGMRPGDAQLTGNLERLLERQGRWRDLIDFLHQQIEGAEPAQVREVRLRIAGLWLNEVGDRARVVEELRALLADPESGSGPDAEAAIALLQRIVADEEASPDIRGDAAGLLRERFAAEHRISDVVGALDAAIAFADSYEKVVLHREAAQHLEEQGKLEEALDHWFEVVRLAPDEESRQKLAELAGRTGKESRRIALLLETAAAMEDPLRRASLRIEAAETRRRLEEPEGAIELYELVLGEETLGEELARACAIELAELYAELGRSAKQLEALERLATLEQGEGRREVLGRVATLAAEIGQADRALAALSMRLEADEADHEALAGTIRILESEERWAELAAALSRRLARPSSPWQRRADLVRKASVEADRLEQIAEAIETWRQIVDGFGENEETVDALSALYDRASRWEDFADVLGRAADREDAHVATVRVRLGDVYREQLGDPARSVREYGRALECEPRNEAARAGLLALAEIDSVRREATEALARNYRSTDDWAPLLELLDRRMELAPDVASRLDLLDEAARLQSERADNSAAAAGSMARALLLVPSSRRYEAELLRLAEAAGAWDLAADAFRGAATEASEIAERRGELLSVEARLREERLGDAAGALIPAVGALRAEPHRLEYAQRVVELARAAERLDVAEAALSASVEGAVAIEQLDLLAELRRAAPSRALYELLLRIAEQEPSRLGELREASELALGTLEDSRAAAAALERLYLRASTAWRRGAESSASEHALWSFERLVELDEAAGRHAALVDRLSEASRLPIEPERSLALRRRAASITHRELGDRARSMDLYRDILAVAPDDLEAMSSLGELLEEAERWPELLGLRRLELSKTEETAARLELRLKIAALIDRIDADGGRIESLSRNLGEQPGHPPTIEALEAVLDAQRRYEELAQLLASQAKEVEPELAVRLWRKLADVSERKLEDTERALEGWRRVAELSQSAEAYEALARIHEERGEPIPASRWLERRLATASEGEKASAALALSRVLFAAARGERAAEVLEQARLVDPEDRQVRDRLASYYRKVEAIEPLARVLGDAALQAAGHDESLGLVREAATLYCDRLGMPSEAVAILERGVELAPDDRDLRTKLAEGLEQSGRLDEARVVLEALVESYGRRRSSERAHAHFLLGRVLGAQGNLSGALEQADLASKMARASAPMLQMFARLARQAGELDRAEKAYRTLLMTVRRRKADEPFDVGAAEVLYELSVLATEKGDADQANDLLESAMETASQDDVEAERLVESLLARGDAERALLALERRLETATQPPSRARILTEMAGLLDANLGRPEDAFGRCLEALQIHPNHEGLLDSARALASKLEQTSRYLGVLEEILANRRRDEDAGLVALLLVHQGQVLEEDAGDAERAAEIYRKAEQAGQVLVPARLALARLSARRGDTVEQERVLRLLIEDETVPETEQANARYRLAALLLQAERIDEGIETLRAALTDQPRFEEAAQILAETAQRDPNADAVMAVYEDVARGGGDEGMLLDYLERRASREDVTLAQLREAIDKALSFPAPERAEALLERAVKVAEAGEGLVSARWAPAHLAQLREAAGDIPGATGWTERLLQIADPEELRGLRLRLAELASRPGGDLEIAARSYEELLEEDVSARAVWEPLLGVYRSLGEEERRG
ncbi:MAG: tetratricopeptide repeat protein, partial [Myxococcales bacterium]|nr:tetratricopeptide repeat protein [Myxococcales bacterium]